MNKVKVRKRIFSGGLKQKEEIIEMDKSEAERLSVDTSNFDVFYTVLTPQPKH